MSGKAKGSQDVLDQVRLSFEEFRRANKPRTRIPDDLRRAVVDALAQGVSMSALRRTCALGSKQIADWQLRPRNVHQGDSCEPSRVFEVADEARAPEQSGIDGQRCTDALEVRLGGWAITIRNVA